MFVNYFYFPVKHLIFVSILNSVAKCFLDEMSYGQYAASPHCLPRIAFAKMEVVCMYYVFLLRVIKLLACFDSPTRLLHAEWHKKPLKSGLGPFHCYRRNDANFPQ